MKEILYNISYFLIILVCGGMNDQCYCGQMSGQSNWTDQAWPGHHQEATNSGNNNLAATDNYIRQFEEAYTASYSGLDVKFCKPGDLSPSKQYMNYHNLSPSYYPQISPNDKQHQPQYMLPTEESHSQQPPASQQALYHSQSYVTDIAPDYIQPYHIFQVTNQSGPELY